MQHNPLRNGEYILKIKNDLYGEKTTPLKIKNPMLSIDTVIIEKNIEISGENPSMIHINELKITVELSNALVRPYTFSFSILCPNGAINTELNTVTTSLRRFTTKKPNFRALFSQVRYTLILSSDIINGEIPFDIILKENKK